MIKKITVKSKLKAEIIVPQSANWRLLFFRLIPAMPVMNPKIIEGGKL